MQEAVDSTMWLPKYQYVAALSSYPRLNWRIYKIKYDSNTNFNEPVYPLTLAQIKRPFSVDTQEQRCQCYTKKF